MSRLFRTIVVALLAGFGGVALPGCVSALRQPTAVPKTSDHRPEDVDRLLDEAEQLYIEQRIPAMDQAAELWLSAAAADPTRIEGVIGAVRARIWSAQHAEGSGKREAYSSRAVETAQECEARAPEDPLCPYWLALALGVQAQERRWTARDGIPIMIDLLEKVRETDPELEHAAPDRVLALVYVRAPGWPAGPGDPDLAVEYARRAVEIEPDYPPNQLCLAEALGAIGDEKASLETYEAAARLARSWAKNGTLEADDWIAEAEKALASR